MKEQNAFTLIEMMVVMLIISVLLIITIPNVTKHNSNINKKGCEAFVKMVQSQVQSYEIEHDNQIPKGVDDLVSEGYLNFTKCPDGKTGVQIADDGTVSTVTP
ncbi:MAG: competence type IV pilus major pilin ComGC [Bacillota bacterium]|nr:competence type IV pilus major pilin ComGC [Bacillota bacterium]